MPLTKTRQAVWPSTVPKVSAPRIIVFSLLNSPARPYRCRRFACTLTSADARLAEKRGSVTPSFRGTSTPYLPPVRLAHQNMTLHDTSRTVCAAGMSPRLRGRAGPPVPVPARRPGRQYLQPFRPVPVETDSSSEPTTVTPAGAKRRAGGHLPIVQPGSNGRVGPRWLGGRGDEGAKVADGPTKSGWFR